MRKLSCDNGKMKSIVGGVLLIGGLAAGIVGAGIAAYANEAVLFNAQKDVRNRTGNNSQNLLDASTPVIETEDDLAKLVEENGSQVMVDESTGKMYLAYLNDQNQIEVTEITQDELNDLINQVSRISNVEEESNSQGGYIPREYLRGVNNQEQKKQRARLNSEEGKQAIERAKEYKRSNK